MPYKEEELFYILIALVNSLCVLKDNRIAHYIKLTNILVVSNPSNPQEYIYKLGDFGESHFFGENDPFPQTSLKSLRGLTFSFASPVLKKFVNLTSILRKKAGAGGEVIYPLYNPFSCDVYSLALTIANLTDLKKIEIQKFHYDQNFQNILILMRLHYPKLALFLEKMLRESEEFRIPLNDLQLKLEDFKEYAQAPIEIEFLERVKHCHRQHPINNNIDNEEEKLNRFQSLLKTRTNQKTLENYLNGQKTISEEPEIFSQREDIEKMTKEKREMNEKKRTLTNSELFNVKSYGDI